MKKFNPEKELSKIKNGKRNKIIFTMVFGIILLTIGYSFALYQVRHSKRIIYNKVAPFKNYDIDLAVYINGTEESDFPENIGNGYIFDKIDCEIEGITSAKWDYEQNGLSVLTNGANKCNIYFIEGQDFIYNGGIQQYTIPKTGNYKLEVWGAQGGTGYSTYINTGESLGGKGGYSSGNIRFEEGSELFIVIGSAGANTTTDKLHLGPVAGGYNGGGQGRSYNNNNSYVHNGAGGGGATHIATETGLLSTFINKRESLLIVAGGGGGGGGHNPNLTGGTGGGLVGGDTLKSVYDITKGGNQDGAGTSNNYPNCNGSFGIGGNSITGGGGGGAGYYGGAGGYWNAGGGGSGFLNTRLTETKSINGVRDGDGYARVIYLGD